MDVISGGGGVTPMAIVDYPLALAAFVSDDRTFNSNTCSEIVLHCTGSPNPDQTSQQLGGYFAVTPLRTSVHYGIDRRGVTTQYCLERRGAGGNCCLEVGHDVYWDKYNGDNLNLHTISIECANNADNSLPLTLPQKVALFALVVYLCKKYSLTFDHIKTHASIAPLSRARCPGDKIPWDELQTHVVEALAQPVEEEIMQIELTTPRVSNYFTQAPGGAWHCPKTGFTVGGAILQFYKAFGNSALCGLTWLGLPMSNEQAVADHQGVVEQAFERATLQYDVNHVADNPPGVVGTVYLTHQKGL